MRRSTWLKSFYVNSVASSSHASVSPTMLFNFSWSSNPMQMN
nr:MAG TPA: hypothetical protein [Caudoviricetes sp.]